MRNLQKQKGMSLIGLSIILFLIVFFGMVIVKMSGTYFDHMTMDKMITSGVEGQSGTQFNIREFNDRLSKNMNLNNIQMNLKEALKVNKAKKPNILEFKYEKRVHFISNVDVVMSFNEEYEL